MQSALADFQQDIARIQKVADWLTVPDALTPAMIPATVAIRCGAVVLLSGYLEAFIKNAMRGFIDNVNQLSKPLSKLPRQMMFVHFEKGARALTWELKKARRSDDTSVCEDLASRIASVKTPTGYTLAWEAFADTEANPGPAVVKDLLNAVGIKDPWTAISDLSQGISLKLFLTSFMEMRNECAHSGNATSPPTASDLIDYGKNLENLAIAIVLLLEQRLRELSAF